MRIMQAGKPLNLETISHMPSTHVCIAILYNNSEDMYTDKLDKTNF